MNSEKSLAQHALLTKALTILILFLACPTQAEDDHGHDGFYLSLNYGGTGSLVHWDRSTQDASGTASFISPGILWEIKIGGAVRENLILSFDLGLDIGVGVENFSGKGVGINSLGVDAPDTVDFGGISSAGLGITQYFMPQNIFWSATLGIMGLIVSDRYGSQGDDWYRNQRTSNAKGPFFQLKVGKEWWVSENWGLGVSAFYSVFGGKESPGRLGVDTTSSYVIDPSYKGSFVVNRFGVLFNTTFN